MMTMGLFAEEKKRGTIELLLTTPVGNLQALLGGRIIEHGKGSDPVTGKQLKGLSAHIASPKQDQPIQANRTDRGSDTIFNIVPGFRKQAFEANHQRRRSEICATRLRSARAPDRLQRISAQRRSSIDRKACSGNYTAVE